MRFQIFGGLDAPDWLLANIAVLSSVASKTLINLSVGIMKEIVEEEDLNVPEELEKLKSLKGLKEKKMAISTIRYIIENAARFNVNAEVFLYELQQIGFPKDHSEGVCKAYSNYRKDLVGASKTLTMRLPKLLNLNWRVDYMLGSSKIKEIHEPSVFLSVDVSKDDIEIMGDDTVQKKNYSFEVSWDKFRVLHHELKEVKKLMLKVQE